MPSGKPDFDIRFNVTPPGKASAVFSLDLELPDPSYNGLMTAMMAVEDHGPGILEVEMTDVLDNSGLLDARPGSTSGKIGASCVVASRRIRESWFTSAPHASGTALDVRFWG